jgi:hypothetical protein
MDGQKPEQTPAPTQFAPGDTIRPQQASTAEPTTQQQPVVGAATQPQPTQQSVVSTPIEPVENMSATPPLSDPEPQGPSANYTHEQTDDAITWTASEFIAHHKTSGWYALLLLASVVGAGLIWLVTRDILSAVVVVFAGAMLATYAARKPRQLNYQLDPAGLTIGTRHYSYNEFRSFSIVPEGAFSSIVFSPLKRFGTLTTIYYDPQDEERIVETISHRLPHEEHRPDPIDGMMRRIRF